MTSRSSKATYIVLDKCFGNYRTFNNQETLYITSHRKRIKKLVRSFDDFADTLTASAVLAEMMESPVHFCSELFPLENALSLIARYFLEAVLLGKFAVAME